ncbi:MAG: glycogen/starch/alpha-glucan phosphorylase [Erysipelotrichaceae bacterium]|nr:glycogen/starch/alpha-glucan phosphorylase [Erysipelotrichaceae bacterium]
MFSNVNVFKETFKRRLAEKYSTSIELSHVTEQFDILGEMVRDYANYDWRAVRTEVKEEDKKQLIYFSMEFLMGRLLLNNLQNLGIYDIAKKGLEELGIDINKLEDQEADAGLGNGGLGRLAACFLDSISSLGYPVQGNCIRYEYGFFRQLIQKGKQFEVPDQWLTNGYVFEVRKPKHSVEVEFGGYTETYIKENGEFGMKTVNATHVKAVPYDVSVVGYRNRVTNTLRLWSAEPSEENLPKHMSFEEYLHTLKELSHGLYPDDSTEKGRILRLKQQYFLVSAGLQTTMREHYKRRKTLLNLADYYVYQLNDTHPILAIPELMRIMMDMYGYGWDEAWATVTKCIAYTNHTIMQEALERWSIQHVQQVCPRCYMIIEEINRRFNLELIEKNVDQGKRYAMQIIKDGQIHMANLAIYTAFSVNGVAKLHTDILKTETFKEFYELYPNKFNNKTNGVTHRRWLMYANPKLADLITSKIGDKWIVDMDHKLIDFKNYQNDKFVQEKVMDIKHENKLKLAKYIKEKMDIDVDPNSIFDVQIKRLHAYKRQLMNLFHIMYLYQRIVNEPDFTMHPRTFIFGAKAAPSYVYAKRIIELILAVADVVNNDPRSAKFMKVVFIENYGVSLAELIIPAADVSEQISTASKEASGTSNMKLMMNGAITLGTMDGANVEIHDLVGEDNIVIFGLSSNEVLSYYANGTYSAWNEYNNSQIIQNIMQSLFNGPWADSNRFQLIFDEIMNNNDCFFILKDLPEYIKAQERIEKLYQDKQRWAQMCIANIGSSGYFTSDRTIEQYVEDIWHLSKVGN